MNIFSSISLRLLEKFYSQSTTIRIAYKAVTLFIGARVNRSLTAEIIPCILSFGIANPKSR